MQALIDRFSDELTRTYVQYLESFLVDLSNEDESLELRCGFSLRRDHELRSITVKFSAQLNQSDRERELLIAAVFDEVESMVDAAIAEGHYGVN